MKFWNILKQAFTQNIPYKIIAFLLALMVTIVANIVWMGL